VFEAADCAGGHTNTERVDTADQASTSISFWFDRARRPTHPLPWGAESEQDRRRLWTEIERLSG
jgi:hypothetical protein